jgi:uncharacterized RDD family membrane protein YckC
MHQEENSISKTPISLSFDDFEINIESFKPVTKGLGFHHDQKRTTFKPVQHTKIDKVHSSGPLRNISADLEVKIKNQAPSGLEAFYGTSALPVFPPQPIVNVEKIKNAQPAELLAEAPATVQFFAWITDIIVLLTLVVITVACLVIASGIHYSVIVNLVTKPEIMAFTSSLFAIYYVLYFTILDLSASPGKIIFGIRLVNTESQNLSIKNTFIRSIVSLLSIIVFTLPMLLDFQGRLSDTKLVK